MPAPKHEFIAERLLPLFYEFGDLTQVGALRMLRHMATAEKEGRLITSSATIKRAFEHLGAVMTKEPCGRCGQQAEVWRLPKPTQEEGDPSRLFDAPAELERNASRARKAWKEAVPGVLEEMGISVVPFVRPGDNMRSMVRRESGLPQKEHWPDFIAVAPDRPSFYIALVTRAEVNDKPGRGFTIDRARHHMLGGVEIVMGKQVLYLFSDRKAVWHRTLAPQPDVNWRLGANGAEEFMLLDTARFADMDALVTEQAPAA